MTRRNECDTNSDMCCLSKNFIILEYTRCAADVYAYDKYLDPIEGMPIVYGFKDWDKPIYIQYYILVINEALYYRNKLDHSLINPNQVRSYGLGFYHNYFNNERGGEIDVYDSIYIPMKAYWIKVLFDSISTSEQDLRGFPKIHLPSNREWNQMTPSLSSVVTNKEEHTPSFRISEQKFTLNLN